MSRFNRFSHGVFGVFLDRVLSCSKLIAAGYWFHPSVIGALISGGLISFIAAVWCSLLFLFPASDSVAPGYGNPDPVVPTATQCDVFEGSWIQDEGYPLYNASDCGFAERGFNCLANGREDGGYLKWRWKPRNCVIPRFDPHLILEELRGKRVVFVGDSLSRTQWESMICMLMSGVKDKRSVYEINGNEITKRARFLGVRFGSFNLTIEFFRSVFLVQHGRAPKRAPKRVKWALKLDNLDNTSEEWVNSDVLIFNSGHWWTREKLFKMGWYFQLGRSLKLGMPITTAFNIALKSWASWVERRIDPRRTTVFFRTFESSHWSNQGRRHCGVTGGPSWKMRGRNMSPISDAIIKATKNTTVAVKVLHVTAMGALRSDGHVARWGDNPSVPDCSHWCLPGVPDMWNEILFFHLLSGH